MDYNSSDCDSSDVLIKKSYNYEIMNAASVIF